MERIEEILLQAKFSHTANMMIKQLKSGEITLKEYLTQCAYWGVKTLDDIYFMSYPTRSLEVIEYEQLSYFQRQRLSGEYFADNPEVMRYYDRKEWVETQNRTDLINLKIYKKHIPESDIKSHEKLDKKILDFKMKMEGV
jgi:hypothetical protein